MPLVSVIVPCLNRAHFLIPTIESILQQDYPHIECIIVDGGSTDGTLEILQQYKNRVKWVSEPDSGHADAINKGWWMSRGNILSWLNADDLLVVPNAIREAATYFEKNLEVDVVYGDYSEIAENGEVIRGVLQPPEWDLVSAVKYCRYTIPQPASFMRRSILEKVGWLDTEFRNGKDHELWLRIGLAGTIKHTPVHMAYVRICQGLSQRLDMGLAKVMLTEKFFRQPDLPAPFNSERFKRRAVSNSYLVGSVYIWRGTKQFRPTLQYLMRALAVDPSNCSSIMVGLLSNLFRSTFSLLPRPWRKKIKAVVRRVGLSTDRSLSY